MSLPNEISPLGFLSGGTAAEPTYQIERSLRFNSADTAYLNRTFSAGDKKKWTWAGWVKRSKLWDGSAGAIRLLHTWPTAYNRVFILYDKIYIDQQGTGGFQNFGLTSVSLHRDPSAWMHVVIVFDVAQAVDTNRVKFYVNGVEVATSGVYPPQNTDTSINGAHAHDFGSGDGYLAEVHFIDGQALDPTSFGKFDDNGVWQPKAYSGSYGTNGFYLDFSDNSTAAALGTDSSGNGNTWTVNNISVAAGSGNDSFVDVPTNGSETDTGVGGEVRGNYCTWNPLFGSGATLSNGNLDTATYNQTVTGTFYVSSGKWYWEVTIGGGQILGVCKPGELDTTVYTGQSALSYGYNLNTGNKINAGVQSAYGATGTSGDVIGVALDLDAGELTFYKNGASQGVAFSGLSGPFTPQIGRNLSLSDVTNFGQRPFAYPVSGFKALCTANLPAPTIEDGSTAMDVVTYTGNGGNQNITGLKFQPDFFWGKSRSASGNHGLVDAVRGGIVALYSNLSNVETSDGVVTSFNSDGLSLGNSATTNSNLVTYVGWTWDAGTTTDTNNTAGTITPTGVRANTSAGFSIVTYTGNGAASATIGHGLNVAPQMIMVKNRDVADDGVVYHVGTDATSPQNYYLTLFSTSGGTYGRFDVGAMWNDTAPTSTVFSVGTEDNVNAINEDYVAYCFTSVAGYSAFGSYPGNGLADGPVVYTGMRPKFILVKASDGSTGWTILDSVRNTYNVSTKQLFPHSSNQEIDDSSQYLVADLLSNGFKIRTSNNASNANTYNYIYAAFAENPFSLARAR